MITKPSNEASDLLMMSENLRIEIKAISKEESYSSEKRKGVTGTWTLRLVGKNSGCSELC
jgi:hypothetical protein